MNKKLSVQWTRSLIIGLSVAAFLVVLDLSSKWIVEWTCKEGELNALIPNFLYITKSYNTAIAFSIGSGLGVWGRVLNIAISLIMSVLILGYWLTHNEKLSKVERVCAVLLGAGAVGNLIDRAFYWKGTTGFDGVIDFIQFYLGGGPDAKPGFFNPFATFNVADACLTIGIVVLLIAMILDMIKNPDRSMERDPRLEKPEPIKSETSEPSEPAPEAEPEEKPSEQPASEEEPK